MASCFKNPNKKNLSAKDYTIKKRRKTIFCDLRDRTLENINNGTSVNTSNNIACVDDNGIIFKYNNHKSQLDMISAFEEFRTDLLKSIRGQVFTNDFCSPYENVLNNKDISNNYYAENIQLAYGDGTGYGHLTNYFGSLNITIDSINSSINYNNTYCEIKHGTPDTDSNTLTGFKNNKFVLLKPDICNKPRVQLLKQQDVPAPEALNIEIIID